MDEQYSMRESPYTWDLEVEGYGIIDVEIREVIAAINRVPCVVRTLFSCAGYGEQGELSSHPDGPHLPSWSGYVVVDHGEARCSLHQELSAAVDYTSDWTTEIYSWPQGERQPNGELGIASYRLDGRCEDHDAALARKWAEVLRVVRQHVCSAVHP